MNDGTLFSPGLKTLVASARFVFNYARAYRQFGDAAHREKMIHGLNYLRNGHRNPRTGGYAWKIEDGRVTDTANHCYGLAFVLLAYACAVEAGFAAAREWVDETAAVMERRFWNEEDGRYANEADAEWNLTPYRGQNDNMHACEALVAAHAATGGTAFLDRACALAEAIAGRAAARGTQGHIWEHFTTDWRPDFEYKRGDKSNSLRPWGVQTGHQTEWAKLLLILDRYRPEAWRLERARELFDAAMKYGWDDVHGGLIYGYDLSGEPCDYDKYFWVQAESIAAAALLADRTGNAAYWDWYSRLWEYSFKHFVDHRHGAWFRILSRENVRYDDRKSYNNKADYHTMGACYEVLNVVAA
jgi:mannose/cellobiose epimerase-like protein (N-acyl-D-glucosamine 2-epimerase family)